MTPQPPNTRGRVKVPANGRAPTWRTRFTALGDRWGEIPGFPAAVVMLLHAIGGVPAKGILSGRIKEVMPAVLALDLGETRIAFELVSRERFQYEALGLKAEPEYLSMLLAVLDSRRDKLMLELEPAERSRLADQARRTMAEVDRLRAEEAVRLSAEDLGGRERKVRRG